MLIIFDLDDTLIDTSGCITYYKLEDSLNAMINAGLMVPDPLQSLDLLRRLNKTAESAFDALHEFLEILDAEMQLLEVGVKEIYENISSDLPVFALEGAIETLLDLSVQHELALVSNGIEPQQMEKMKKAGIDSRIFSKIAILEDRDKKPRYQNIVDELGYASSQVIVCGDRVAIDLIPARELGFKTIQIRWGRGLNAMEMKSDIDYSISSLKEIKNIVSSLTPFSIL